MWQYTCLDVLKGSCWHACWCVVQYVEILGTSVDLWLISEIYINSIGYLIGFITANKLSTKKLLIKIKFLYYLTRIMLLYKRWHIFYHILLNTLRILEKVKTHMLCSTTFFSKRAVCEVNARKYCAASLQVTILYGTYTLCAGQIGLQTHTHTHLEYMMLTAFPITNIVSWTHLIVTSYLCCLSC
jgi:hypothetical protein